MMQIPEYFSIPLRVERKMKANSQCEAGRREGCAHTAERGDGCGWGGARHHHAGHRQGHIAIEGFFQLCRRCFFHENGSDAWKIMWLVEHEDCFLGIGDDYKDNSRTDFFIDQANVL